ncbi:MAG: hypothetical protein H0Z24_10685, partial [Thermosipho sp. (in: Bacteria)]|nr:hypothetical protein [Thermosipho sp. (in: thermotogales)]
MKKIPEGLKVIFKYGSFSLPFVNYFLENANSDIWKPFSRVLKFVWNGDFTKGLHEIDRCLKKYNSNTVRYLLLANKLSLMKNTGNIDIQLYKYLKRKLPKMSKQIRNNVVNILINLEASRVNLVRNFRLWKNRYKINDSTLAFLHLALARRYATQGKLSTAVYHYIQSYKLS